MKRYLLASFGIVRAVITGIIVGRATAVGSIGEDRVMVTSLSPDNSLRVQLIDLPVFDRNFEICLDDLRRNKSATILRSPDEGRPEGSERIIWASDGSRFVLVGRHFVVHDDARLPTGETLYLMHDVCSGQTCDTADDIPALLS